MRHLLLGAGAPLLWFPISAARPFSGPSVHTGAFPHTEETKRVRGRQKFWIETLAVITDAQGEPVAVGVDRYFQDCGIRVTNDVGKDFLKNAEHGEGRLGGKTSVLAESAAAATNSGARFKFLELPVEGRRQPQIFENSRAHLGGDPADRVHGQVDATDHRRRAGRSEEHTSEHHSRPYL